MRRAVLWSSVSRQLPAEETPLDVAYMWRRRPVVLPFALIVGVVVGVLARVGGFGPTSSVAVGLAALAIAGSAATDYRVLALTDVGLVMFRGGRLRQVAKPPMERLAADVEVTRVSNNLVISDWRVGEARYSVLRRFESTMAAIAGRPAP